MKKILSIVICVAILFPSICQANSMPTYYYGSGESVNDAVLLNEDCPIEVKSELLTFDLQEFPQDYYEYGHEFNEYEGEVTAEYTFYNPTDEEITARLAFPFGNMPDYAPYDLGEDASGKWWQKEITVDGKVIEPAIRLTYCGYGDFNAYDEREKLIDGYADDTFYKPDLPVTKYVYDIQTDVEDASNVEVRIEMNMEKTDSKIAVNGYIREWNEDEKTATVELYVDNSRVEFYVIGEENFDLEWKFRDWEEEKDVEGKAIESKKEEMTFEEFARQSLEENVDGTKSDKYNTFISYLKDWEHAKGIIEEYDMTYISDMLMYWYEYEITFEPKTTVKNTVTAPLYPSIDTSYEPPVYEYVYLLSPAKMWADFGDLEIIIKTPSYMTECSMKGFEKTDEGYRLKRNGLPEDELEFSLSESENPKIDPDILSYRLSWIFYLVGIPVLFIGCIAVVIIFVVRRSKKKEQ